MGRGTSSYDYCMVVLVPVVFPLCFTYVYVYHVVYNPLRQEQCFALIFNCKLPYSICQATPCNRTIVLLYIVFADAGGYKGVDIHIVM